MASYRGVFAFLLLTLTASAQQADFLEDIRPVLDTHCRACHNPDDKRNRHNFLQAEDPSDVETRRTLWRDVATQLRNRTMPPGDAAITEAERLLVAEWIQTRLDSTGCRTGEYAGYVAPRRLNRREYRNTIRDLFGVELEITDLFSADESGGAGFDTNGATLYLPPMLIERYMQAAQRVTDRLVVAPPFDRVFLSHELSPVTEPAKGDKPRRRISPGEKLTVNVTAFTDAAYTLRVSAERPATTPFYIDVEVDGVNVGTLNYDKLDSNGGATARTQTANLGRGAHSVTLVAKDEPFDLYSLTVTEKKDDPTADQRAIHHRFFGLEPGDAPIAPRRLVDRILARLLPRAFRRPVQREEVDRFLALYDRSAERGDPFEESVKYALQGVLLSPNFLFRYEEPPQQPGLQPLGQYEMATRLAYFLWSSMPDQELIQLAEQGRLQDRDTLIAQVDRMLDDPRSRSFAASFMGQWLGTKELGGRKVPLITALQHYYTPAVAADLRQQPELLFHYMLSADRPILDFLDGDYTFLSQRLVKYYQLEGKVDVGDNGFHRVQWPDDKRAGVLGLASVLAITSHYRETSPILRGAWVLETLLGTPVPPPPPDVPELEKPKDGKKLSMREMLAAHRASSACSTCHNLMDPIGLGLENFDFMGRWRDEENDEPVNATGSLPTGESFDGPAELRQVLMEQRKPEFLRQIVSKVLGYAIGRGRQDGDLCTIESIVRKMEAEDYSTRTLIREIVLSPPFRYLENENEPVRAALE